MAAPTNRHLIQAALGLAQRNDRATILEALQHFPAPGITRRDPDHLWLWAELCYRRGDFPQSRLHFEAWRREAETGRPRTWMRFLSHLRCAYTTLRMGDGVSAANELAACEALLARHPEFETDVEAMHAHLLELEGSSELARARFLSAHQMALERDQYRRAATSASDVGRLLVDLDRHADAWEWQHKALRYLRGRNRDEYIERTILVRLAKLDKTMGRVEPARESLRSVCARCKRDGVTPKAHVNALLTLHDIELLRSDLHGARKAAEEHLREASEVAERRGLRPNLVTIKRQLARLRLTHPIHPQDEKAARQDFEAALRLALELTPTPRLMLRHFAEDILDFGILAPPGKRSVERTQKNVESALRAFSRHQRGRQLGQGLRRRTRRERAQDLEKVLREVVFDDRRVELLADCVFRVRRVGGAIEVGRKSHRLTGAEAKILSCLADESSPLTIPQIASRFNGAQGTVSNALTRFKRLAPRSLVSPPRKGQHGMKQYRLVWAEEVAKSEP